MLPVHYLEQAALARDNAQAAQRNAQAASDSEQEAKRQRRIAESSVKELKLAQAELALALSQTTEERELAEEQRQIAQAQEKLAEEQRQLADERAQIADEKTLEANKQTAIVQILRDSALAKNRLQPPNGALGLLLAIATTDRSQQSEFEVFKETITTALDSLLLGLQKVQESNRLLGHKSEVSSIAISPNGERIVSGGFDGTVRIWDAATGEPIGQPLEGHEIGGAHV